MQPGIHKLDTMRRRNGDQTVVCHAAGGHDKSEVRLKKEKAKGPIREIISIYSDAAGDESSHGGLERADKQNLRDHVGPPLESA